MRAGVLNSQLTVGKAAAVLASCAGALMLPAMAQAHTEPLEFTMKVTEGETTTPEHGVAGTSGYATNNVQLRLVLIHNGIVAAEDNREAGEEWGIGFSNVPVPGDVLKLESPAGTVVGAVTYDGLPSIDPTVCAGSTNFSGQRSGAESVQGRFFTLQQQLDRYGRPIPRDFQPVGEGFAQVTSLVGSAFGGNFLTPLPNGATVTAKEAVEEPLGGGTIFTYESETVRPVGACPAPPPPPPPPPAPLFPALHASIAKLLLKLGGHKGLRDKVYIDQRGTVVQDLFLAGGTLPAHASKHHALLLARGSASASRAGTVTISLRPTSRGRSRLQGSGHLNVVLITTIHGANGSTITLGARHLSLHH